MRRPKQRILEFSPPVDDGTTLDDASDNSEGPTTASGSADDITPRVIDIRSAAAPTKSKRKKKKKLVGIPCVPLA